MTTRVFSSGIRRREDPRLITGRAAYTDDIKLPGMAHAAILRSPYAHASISSIDTSAAASQPGVIAVFTAEDTEGALNGLPCAWLIPGSDLKTPAHPAIAKDKVRYVGDAVAVVVAESRYEAEDALEHIAVEYEPMGAVISPKEAAQDGAPQLHDDVPNNIAFTWAVAGGDTDAAFEQADVTVGDTITLQRLIANAMEPRAAIAQWSAPMGELTLWSTSQNPHIARFLTSVVTGVPEHKIRVIAPEVGGGFGSKIPYYPDEAITAFCAMRLGVPVKWTETRSENYQVTTQGRDHIQEVEMAATSDGRITGLRTTVYAGMGAYLFHRQPRRSDDFAWSDVLGLLRHPEHQRHGIRRVQQRHSGGRLPRRGPAGGDDAHRAPRGLARREARRRPRGTAPEEPDSQVRQRSRRGYGHHLR